MVDLRRAAKRATKRARRRPDPARVETETDTAPTFFHGLMRGLADRGKLARVYTQNVDGLEAAAGLLSAPLGLDDTQSRQPFAHSCVQPARLDRESEFARESPQRRQSTLGAGRGPVVTLHGTLDRVICSICHHTTKWKKCHTLAFKKGRAKKCPICYGRGASGFTFHPLRARRSCSLTRQTFHCPC